MATPIENFNLVEGVNLDDSQFTDTEILSAQAIIRQYISDKYVDLDLSELSSLNDLVVRPMAQVFLVIQKLIVDFSKTNTLSEALKDPAIASTNIVDALLSNFSIQRRTGNIATGRIKITVGGTPSSVSVPKDTIFSTIDGLTFSPEYDSVAAETPTEGSRIKLYVDTEQNQSFAIIPVVAAAPGSKYNVEQFKPFTVDPEPFQLIHATAFSKFSGGDDEESNQEVIGRLIPALSARNLASPLAIEQTLRDNFPSIQQLSIHGINSQLMSRNSHNIFSIKSGCMCDVYVKTSSFIEQYQLPKIATLISSGSSFETMFPDYIGKHIVKVSRWDVPGHYNVTYVTPQDDDIFGTYIILNKSRAINKYSLSGEIENSITTVQEGAYSSFLEEYIIFDAGADVVDPELAVNVYVEGTPGIQEIQAFVNRSGTQTAMVDTLVKAVIPCIIETSEIKVKVKVGSTTAEEIQAIVISYINSVDPKNDTVRIDGIISALMKNENVISVDTPILITGTILCPDEGYTEVKFSTESILEPPTDLTLGYSPQNIGFFARGSTVPLTITEI